MEQEKKTKGVWIPIKVWENKELGWSEKCLLVEINSLDNELGCYSGNKYFADFFGLSKDRISKMISSLKDKGYISVDITYKQGSKEVDKRTIRVNQLKFNGIVINNDTYMTKQLGGIGENNDTPIGENAEDNNTSFNNTFNIINNTLPQQVEAIDWEDLFDQFYSMYPKKVNKKKAFDKFKTKYKKHGLDTIMKGTASYAKVMELNNQDKQYIKGPDVFLNGEHYLDDNSELLKKKPNQQMTFKPWEEEFNNGYTTNSYANENHRTELPRSTKQIGWQ